MFDTYVSAKGNFTQGTFAPAQTIQAREEARALPHRVIEVLPLDDAGHRVEIRVP
jgi:hypothetical protein